MNALPIHLSRYAVLALFTLSVGCGASASVNVEESTGQARGAVETTPLLPADTCADWDAEVYFSPFDDVVGAIERVLDEATSEVILAHYNIRYQPLLDRLVALHERGVVVRVVVDASRASDSWNTGDDFLEAHGIEVLRTKPPHRYALMHLKVAVIDGTTLMTGSFNWNETAARFNEENMLVIRDPAMAEQYREQVLSLLDGEQELEPEPAEDACAAVYFSPERHLDDPIVAQIDAATSTIDLAMFVLTERDIGRALLRAVSRGVEVRVVTEMKMADYSWIDEALEEVDATVIRGANILSSHSAMHIKFALIDDTTLLTGATNWTHNGTTRSNEDLIITDHIPLVEEHMDYFSDLLWIYGGVEGGRPRPEAPIFFHMTHANTQLGDRVVLTGNHPKLGNWDPTMGLELSTTSSSFPSWTATIELTAGSDIAFKMVTLGSNGTVQWEPGPNRVIHVSNLGRASVLSGLFGDTSSLWTPLAADTGGANP